MKKQKQRAFLIILATTTAFACAPLFAPVSPTLDPNSVKTAIAGTAAAAETKTAQFIAPTWTPSFTPFPSATPSITPTATETFVFTLPTLTKTRTATSIPIPTSEGGGGSGGGDGGSGGGGNKYSCNVLSVNPSNNTVFSPNEDFDARWTVKNTGTVRWDASGVDYVYVSGTAMHQQNGYDLPQHVKAGGQVELAVDMTAPAAPGTYTTTWNIKEGKIYFCNMKITIKVQ
jgi:hypothetical protein